MIFFAKQIASHYVNYQNTKKIPLNESTLAAAQEPVIFREVHTPLPVLTVFWAHWNHSEILQHDSNSDEEVIYLRLPKIGNGKPPLVIPQPQLNTRSVIVFFEI